MPLHTPFTVQMAPFDKDLSGPKRHEVETCVCSKAGGEDLVWFPAVSRHLEQRQTRRRHGWEGESRVSGLGQPSVVIRTPGPRAACLASALALNVPVVIIC